MARPLSFSNAIHLLRRAAARGRKEEAQQLAEMGLEAAVAFLLRDPAPAPSYRTAATRNERGQQHREISQLWLNHWLSTPTPAAERLVLFWHGHLTSEFRETMGAQGIDFWQQFATFRQMGYGPYGELLKLKTCSYAPWGFLIHRDHLKGAAGFPSDDGCYAHSSPAPTLSHPGPPAKPPPTGKALRFLLLQGQAPAQPDQVPRFLHSYPWPTRLAGQEAETTPHLARRRRGLGAPGPGHPGKARPLSPPAALLFGKWGLHLVALYLVYGDLRVPWVYRLWRGEGGKSLALLALRLLAALPPWRRKAFGVRVVGMRRDRRTREGQGLLKLRRQGSGLCGLGQWVPLPSGSGGVWWPPFPPAEGQAEVQRRASLQGHEQRVFFGAIRPENPLRGASFPGASLSRPPAGARSRRERG